jgi:hypothetical protein
MAEMNHSDIAKPETALYPQHVTHFGEKLIDEMSIEDLRFAVRHLKATNNALTGANAYQASLIDRFMQDIPSSELRKFD